MRTFMGIRRPGKTAKLLAIVFGGISACVIVGLAAAYYIAPRSDVGNLGVYLVSALPGFFGYTAVRVICGIVIGTVGSVVMMRAVNVHNWDEMKSKLNTQHNNSHMTLVEGFYLGSMFLAAGTPFVDIWSYVSNLLVRGGSAYILTLVAVCIISLFAGITSIDQLTQKVDEPSNDNYAKLVRTFVFGIMVAATMAR